MRRWPPFALRDRRFGGDAEPAPQVVSPDARTSMLCQRVITAVVLLCRCCCLRCLRQTPWPFAAADAAADRAPPAGSGRRLNGAAHARRARPRARCWRWPGSGGPHWQRAEPSMPPAVWWGTARAWVVVGALALRGGPSRLAPLACRCQRWAIGLLALWVGLAGAGAGARRSGSTSCCRCCAWSGSPTSRAYFGGRAFGRRKLAPTHQPRQELGGCAGRRGRRAGAGGALGVGWSTASGLLIRPASTPSCCEQSAGLGLVPLRCAAGRPQRGRRPVRVAGQARRGCQGQQPPAAGPRRRARPHRRAAAGAARHGAGP